MSKKHNAKLSGLNKWAQLKNRQELYEVDYASKLTQTEKEWLSNFNKEYINADFNHPGKKIHKKKHRTKVQKSTGKTVEFDAAKKDCYDRNNARNNDAFTITKANRYLKDETAANGQIEQTRSTNGNETEDTLIDYLDEKYREDNENFS